MIDNEDNNIMEEINKIIANKTEKDILQAISTIEILPIPLEEQARIFALWIANYKDKSFLKEPLDFIKLLESTIQKAKRKKDENL
jgi:hypothetical protein